MVVLGARASDLVVYRIYVKTIYEDVYVMGVSWVLAKASHMAYNYTRSIFCYLEIFLVRLCTLELGMFSFPFPSGGMKEWSM